MMLVMGAKVCAVCKTPITQPPTGRPRLTCSPRCRTKAYEARQRLHRQRIASRDTWWTPPEIRATVLNRWPIKLDAAATIESALVPEYLGPDHVDPARRDALVVDWAELAGDGAVYLNSPYSVPLLRRFLAKAVDTSGQGTTVIGLLPASTSTQWWAENITASGARVEFLQGRLRFGGPHSTGGPAMFGSALIEW